MNSEERTFFTKIKQAITSNPFSRERQLVDMDLAGIPAEGGGDQKVFKKLLHQVSKKLEKVNETRRKSRKTLEKTELELYRYGILFDLFHNICIQ